MKRVNWKTLTFPTLPIIACIIIAIIAHNQSKQHDKQFAKERQKVQRRMDKRLTPSDLTQSTPVLNNPLDQPPTQPTEKTIYKDTNANMTDHGTQQVKYFSENELNTLTYRYKDGIYKGMNYPEAYKAWKAKRDEIQNRFIASTNRTLQLAEAKIDSADAKLSTILTLFKTMSPEELEIAKSETMKDYPEQADEIESFFNDVANHDTTKSLEEIAKDYQFILESDKTIWTATYKNRSEFDKIVAELNQVDTEKPQRPTFK